MIGGADLSFLIAAAVLVIFASYMIVKNARGSADRSSGPDMSDPSSAPDNIGGKGGESAADEGNGDAGD